MTQPQTLSEEQHSANPFARVARPGGLSRWIPAIPALRTYQRAWLSKDLMAGLVLTAILVPVGMGYAEAAGLPAIYGLYATIVPLIAYAIFGPSRILVLGPDSSLAAIIAATIVPLAAGDPERLVALAGALALMTGALCILAGLARFGFITDLLSKPIRLGYLNGIALTVIVGQLPKLLGFDSSGQNLIQEALSLVQGTAQGLTNWTAFAIGASCLAIVLIFKRRWPKIPGVLVAVVGATIVVGVFNLATVAGIEVVGALPQGLPSFQIPLVSLADLSALAAGAVAITLVSFADTSVLSRTFALRGGYEVDQNQEMIALGAANVAAGFFQGFSISSSSSRTPVAEQAGAKTQLTGVVGAICIALLLVFAPTLLQNLPQAALGEALTPDSSALLLLLEDTYSEGVIDSMGGYDANVVTLTVGDDLSGEIAQYASGSVTTPDGTVLTGDGGVVVGTDDEGDIVAVDDAGDVAIEDAEGDVAVEDAAGDVAVEDAEGDVVVSPADDS